MQLKRTLRSAFTTALLLAAFSAAFAQSDENTHRIGADLMFYTDDNAVLVTSPQISGRYALDDEGSNISARFVVDAVSAASVDVVSHATTHFDEVRYEGALAYTQHLGAFAPTLSYRFSHEPDYLSHGGYLGLSTELLGPDSTLSFGYGLTRDEITRSGTPRSSFAEALTTHAANLSFTQTITPRLLLRAAYSFTGQFGYLEKPYRHVPLFDASIAEPIDASNFDDLRLPQRPPEAVPNQRLRHAVALRGLYYIPERSLALRLDYRFYADDWGVVAHTLEPGLRVRLHRRIQLGASLRFYRQNGARFWQRTYRSDGTTLPRWRSLDRDLSPYTTMTATLRGSWLADSWSPYLQASLGQTFYDDFLLRDHLTAVILQGGVRVNL